MPPDLTPAPRAFRYPFCGWGGNRWATAAGAITAKEPRRCFPHPIVSVAGSHQRVRDFVQDGVSDLLLRIQEREFPAHGDGARAVLTGTESTHSTVKLEVPMGELVFGHQPVGESLCFFQDHRLVEGLIERLIEAREKVQGGFVMFDSAREQYNPPHQESVSGDYQPIWLIRLRIIVLYLFMRSGRRFKGAGRIAASRAACSRPIFRAAVSS